MKFNHNDQLAFCCLENNLEAHIGNYFEDLSTFGGKQDDLNGLSAHLTIATRANSIHMHLLKFEMLYAFQFRIVKTGNQNNLGDQL